MDIPNVTEGVRSQDSFKMTCFHCEPTVVCWAIDVSKLLGSEKIKANKQEKGRQ